MTPRGPPTLCPGLQIPELDRSDVEADCGHDELVSEYDVGRDDQAVPDRDGNGLEHHSQEKETAPAALQPVVDTQWDADQRTDTAERDHQAQPEASTVETLRTLQQELRAAHAYLERRAQHESSDAGRQADAAQRVAEQQEQAQRESARVMRDRAAQQDLSRGYER